MEFEKVIRERFAVRKFKNDLVSDELINKILEAGNLAPTAKDNYSTYEMDACIVATHMMLEATNVGIDNIWIEMFDKNILKQEFNLGTNIEPICLSPLGYRTEDCKPSPMHSTRKNLSEIVEYK